jgi:hypothetical protein
MSSGATSMSASVRLSRTISSMTRLMIAMVRILSLSRRDERILKRWRAELS